MAYQSGEFVIPNGVSARTKAATVFNNTLYLVDPWPGVSTQISFDLTKLKKHSSAPIGDEPIDGDALTDPANWVSQSLSCPASDRKPALVSFAGAMFCFINSAGTLTASTLSLSDDSSSSGTWSKPISLLEADGKTAPDGSRSVYSDVSATTVGENIIIFACALASSSSNPTPGTFVAVYDTRDIQTSGNKWPAKWHDYLPLPPMNPGTLGHVSVEWFSTVAPTGKDTDPPAYYVTVLAQSDAGPDVTESTQVSYYSMTLGETKGNQISVKLARTSSETVGTTWFYANLLRDPAGRPRCWIRKLNTPAREADFEAFLLQLTPGAQGGGMQLNATGESINAGPHNNLVMPCSLFYVFNDGQSATTANGKPATQYPVYEFVFYGLKGQCQVNRCGTIQVIPDFSVRKTQEHLKIPLNVICGIIDGPIPVPLENYKNFNPGPGQTNAGSMIYGVQKSKDSSHKVSSQLSLGFETQGKATKGVGAAWDISLKGGIGHVEGDSSGTTTSYDLAIKGLITTALDNDDPSIVPDGVLRGVGVQFSVTAFRYLDNFGPDVDSTDDSPTDGVKAATFSTSMVNQTVLNFTPYMVKPGVLESYTPEAINARMKSLGYADTDNYFGDVITKNAYPFADPHQPFLGYSWSKDGASGEAFSEWAATFQESSWHLDLHIYGGVSGGTGANIFGLGEEFQWEVMAGVDYSHDSITDLDKKSGWSVGLGDTWGPPFRSDLPESVSAYDFRVYLLPVPVDPSPLTKTYWTAELIAQTKRTDLDGNSGCWRIVYVVTKIEHVDGSKPYRYDGKLDVPTVYTLSGS